MFLRNHVQHFVSAVVVFKVLYKKKVESSCAHNEHNVLVVNIWAKYGVKGLLCQRGLMCFLNTTMAPHEQYGDMLCFSSLVFRRCS